MGDDDVKRLILARRARFVAAALAGLAVARCGGKADGDGSDANPEPCLGVAYPPGPPGVCLTAPYRDAGADADDAGDAGADAGDAGDAGDDADAGPQPCLSPPIDGG